MNLGSRRNRLVKAALAACRAHGHDMPPFYRITTAQSRSSCRRCVAGCRVDAAQPDYPDSEPIYGPAFTMDCVPLRDELEHVEEGRQCG